MAAKKTQEEPPKEEQQAGSHTAPEQAETETAEQQTEQQQAPEKTEQEETAPQKETVKETAKETAVELEQYLRLQAEYDNFRKRSAKERENIYTDARVDTVTRFLPVYDNLERALKAETADEAFKKGVEMTFQQFMEVFRKLGVEEIPAEGQTFDPTLHNAVMHVEDESLGENVIVQELQKGFKIGDKVIRFSMVKVAN